jgi:hypothetical protein
MATTQRMVPYDIIKIEDSPSPEAMNIPTEPVPVVDNTPLFIDPRDPESFLKRCSGFNKKTKLRCNSVIGKKSEQSCHPTFLPTCRTHRDQQTFAGWCQYQHPNGERCSRLFRWTPPYFELCTEHQGHPDTPCFFFKLPLELRHEVFRYLLPDRPIGSSTAQLHEDSDPVFEPNVYGAASHRIGSYRRQPINIIPFHSQPGMSTRYGSAGSVFPMPALDLFLVNRQFYYDCKDLLFSTVPFTIDVRKDGTFMCGRRLLEPRRADGSSHFMVDEADEAKQRFLKYFDWSAVKHYKVDILVENWASGAAYPANSSWDEEVELYDIRGNSPSVPTILTYQLAHPLTPTNRLHLRRRLRRPRQSPQSLQTASPPLPLRLHLDSGANPPQHRPHNRPLRIPPQRPSAPNPLRLDGKTRTQRHAHRPPPVTYTVQPRARVFRPTATSSASTAHTGHA